MYNALDIYQALYWCFENLIQFSQQILIELQFLFSFCGGRDHGLERLNNLPNFTELTNGKFKF